MKKQYENPMIEIQVVDDIDILTCSNDVGGVCPMEQEDWQEDWS